MSGIENASFALRHLGALKDRLAGGDVDAIGVLDTATNVAASSALGEKRALEDAAKQPQAEVTMRLVDGRVVMDAKNLPAKPPVSEVREAEAAPWVKWADTTRLQLSDDPQELLRELGVNAPRPSARDGLIGYLERKNAYRDALNTPVRSLQEAVAAQKFNRMKPQLEVAKAVQSIEHADKNAQREAIYDSIKIADANDERFVRIAKETAPPASYKDVNEYLSTVEKFSGMELTEDKQSALRALYYGDMYNREVAKRKLDLQQQGLDLQGTRAENDSERIAVERQREERKSTPRESPKKLRRPPAAAASPKKAASVGKVVRDPDALRALFKPKVGN